MLRKSLGILTALQILAYSGSALAVSSAELLTTESYPFGRVEARVRFAPGSGVVSSFFSWKDGSEKAGTFWNELDFEKVGAECRLETNPIYGNPSANHTQKHTLDLDLCGAYHTYAYEWTPEAIVWLIDGNEIRRETGAMAQAYADNASQGMQIHFNLWPGDASFGGTFDPSILPVHEYVDWVQFSTYDAGTFTLAWREDFDGATLPARFTTGSWGSPKNKSTHAPENVNFIDGYAVLSLTADDALGPAGASPEGTGGASGGGAAGGTATGGATSPSGGSSAAGGAGLGGAPTAGTAGTPMLGPAPTSPESSGCSLAPVSRKGGFGSGLVAACLVAASALLSRRRGRRN